MAKREMDIDRTEYDFEFTKHFFRSRNLATFRKYVHPEWAGKPITYLEIGVFEGMSMVWMLQKILTHKDAKAIGIDPWLQMMPHYSNEQIDECRLRAYHNTEPWREKCKLIRACSSMYLRERRYLDDDDGVRLNSIDVCMVDGNHGDYPVLNDAINCLKVVKPGGWLLFDDVENRVPKKNFVKDGISMFLKQHGSEVEMLWKDNHMECYKKL